MVTNAKMLCNIGPPLLTVSSNMNDDSTFGTTMGRHCCAPMAFLCQRQPAGFDLSSSHIVFESQVKSGFLAKFALTWPWPVTFQLWYRCNLTLTKTNLTFGQVRLIGYDQSWPLLVRTSHDQSYSVKTSHITYIFIKRLLK